ncbi:MAG: AMP-binding protein, partial [Caldilineaceae bacterium]|nr:AMP-binding protein [Caldilineaceae bacterium]
MIDLQELLAYLHANSIKLWLEDERLRVSAPNGVLTAEMRNQLTFHKNELLLLLEKQAMQHIPPAPRTGKEPLSYAQQRLWFLQLLEENSAYSMPAVLHLQGELKRDILQQAIDTIVARHESLRTTFVEEAGEIYQQIVPPTSVAIPMIELAPSALSEQSAAALRLADNEIRRPFDLAKGPLLRVLLIRILPAARPVQAPPEYYLVFNMHHIVSDGVSIGLLIEEFSALYSAGIRGETANLPTLPVQYADYAVWQRKWLQGKLLEQQAAYWQEKLHGAPPLLELPTDRPRPAQQTFRGKTIEFIIDREMTRKINLFSQQHKATPFMTLLSAFALLLHRYSSQNEILIGTPIAGRGQPEIERLIGLFLNTLVMRASFGQNLTVRELMEQVRQTALDAYAHQDLPFERLIDLLQVERNRSYNPVFQVMFAMQPANPEQLQLPGLNLTPLTLETDMAKFDLNLMIGESSKGLQGELEYNCDLFDAATAQQMVNHFQHLLAAMLAQPTANVATLPMLGHDERHQLLVDLNATAGDYPHTQCLHQLFEAQVERTPHACALVDAGSGAELTYAELNARANQVAHYLQTLGAKPDDLIGLCVERSAHMLVGLLGILKAGAAYVPLDPAFP